MSRTNCSVTINKMATVFATITAGVVAAGLIASQANAAMIDEAVSITASNLSLVAGSGTPIDPVNISFDISLNTADSYSDNTLDISNFSSNLTLGSPLSFSYDDGQGGFPTDELRVGGTAGTGAGCGSPDGSDCVQYDPSTNDFYLYITSFSTSPTFSQLGYSQTSISGDNYVVATGSSTVSLTVTPLTPSVPEPASWTIFLTSLVGLGFSYRQRRR
jgi:hypothetical protein